MPTLPPVRASSPHAPLTAAALTLLLAFAATGCSADPRRPAAGDPRPAVVQPAPYPSVKAAQRPDKRDLQLVFGEEFEGDRVDPKYWNTELAWGRENNEELQYYSEDSLQVRDGMLAITARKQPSHDREYTSGVIASFDKYVYQYGYLEVRARTVKGQGLWPAFWTLSSLPKDPNEIDLIEQVGHNPYRNQMSLHWGFGSAKRHSMTYTGPDYADEFHTYAVDWTPDRMVWYVDNIERFRASDHIPSAPMYLIANLAVGGRYPGPPDETTPETATYLIDYIRVYKGERHQANGQASAPADQ